MPLLKFLVRSLKTKDVQCVVVVVVAVVVVQPLVFVLWLDFNVVLVLVLSFLTQQLCFTCAGEVDEMQLSEKELLLVEKEVEKRMIPVRQDFEQERTKYQEILNKVEDEEEEKVEEKGGKKKRK